MLHHPLEEQFDLPAAFVERGDSQYGRGGNVGQEHQHFAGVRKTMRWANNKYRCSPETSDDFFNSRLYEVTFINVFAEILVVQY